MFAGENAFTAYHGRQFIDIRCLTKPYAIAFMKDGSQVICGENDKTLRRWRTNDGQEIPAAVKMTGHVHAIETSKDGRWIVLAEGRKVVVLDAETDEKVMEVREHQGQVGAIDISADSTKIASGSEDDTAYVFSITTGKKLLGPLEHNIDVIGVKFSPDGMQIATATPISVRVWDLQTGEKLIDIPVVSVSYPVSPFAWSGDSKYLFAATPGWITCIDVSTSATLDSWSFPSRDTKPPLLVSNGRLVACCTGTSVYFLDISSRTQVGSIKFPSAAHSIALSPSGSCLACGRIDNTISLYALSSVLPQYTLLDPAGCLPLMNISEAAFKPWLEHDLVSAEAKLSKEIMSSQPSNHMFANRALVQTRLCKWDAAIVNAKESLSLQPSPIGHIALALALVGKGEQEQGLRTIDLVFRDCGWNENRFLLLVKAILSFVCGKYEDAIVRVQDLMSTTEDDIVLHCCIQVLANMFLSRGDYEAALRTFQHSPSLPFYRRNGHLATITLIFGWTFQGLDVTVYQHLCQSLFAAKRISDGADCLLKLISMHNVEFRTNKANADWVTDFIKKYATALENNGDESTEYQKYDDAIAQYSIALSLDPPSKTSLLVKRCRARAVKRLWREALDDADMAINEDPSFPWGYECRHLALHCMQRYDEAIDALRKMLSVIERYPDSKIRELRKNYVTPDQTIDAIDSAIRQIIKICPLVLIDVKTGRLCGTAEQVRIFKGETAFKELVSSTTVRLDKARITRVVAKHFRYVMFSHVWEGKEPLFQDVSAVSSVWALDSSPLNEKLHKFCDVVRNSEKNYRWAWSDTSCIDKTTSTMLNESLMSMYKWYEDSAETLVYLADVESPSLPGALTRSLWMTRSWTLQELLAPRVIRFYDRNWKPYLNETCANHKESTKIMKELATAIQLAPGTIVTFRPSDLSVREKLRLASARNATIEEDEAYSLIGIFSSDIRPHYGERDAALGHLLEEIVSRSSETTVLAWTGRSSTYNSCLPASLAVYNRASSTVFAIDGKDMEIKQQELRSALSVQKAKAIYKRVVRLQAVRFANRRLYLPCIIFPVKRLGVQQLADNHLQGNRYLARVSGLGKVEFSTTEVLPLQEPHKVVFVHPWIREIRGGDGGLLWADEPDGESMSEVDSGKADSSTDDASTPLSAVPSAGVDDVMRALLMIVRLAQPFSTLVLLEQSDGSFKRVASENEIIVRIEREVVSLKDVRARVVEVR